MTIHKLKREGTRIFSITWCGLKVYRVAEGDWWQAHEDEGVDCLRCKQAYQHTFEEQNHNDAMRDALGDHGQG
jgi:hypothetical protein